MEIIEENPENYYKIGTKLGEGGSALVYSAESLKTGETFAIKRIMIGNAYQREEILTEITLCQLSTHKNMISLFEAYEYNFSLWIIEELMVCNLTEVIQINSGNICEEVIGFILQEVCNALLVLHTNHRIHRDVKSDNILISKEGDVKLADLGCAVQMYDGEAARNTIIGTPGWMAPELALGNSYDNKIDVWSIGILAIQLAEGRIPYCNESPMKILLLTATKPAFLLTDPGKWSNKFIDIVGQCLQKDPEIRPSICDLLFHEFFTSLPKDAKQKYQQFMYESNRSL